MAVPYPAHRLDAAVVQNQVFAGRISEQKGSAVRFTTFSMLGVFREEDQDDTISAEEE